MNQRIKVLFVCHGNICRSPAAEGTFKKLLQDRNLENYFLVDSAGVSSYHIGEKPHPLTIKAAMEKGIVLNHVARKFTKEDLEKFDYIFAMDRYNYEDIMSYVSDPKYKDKIFLFRKFDPEVKDKQSILDVPDPYYGGYEGFREVQRIISRTSESLLEYLLETNLNFKK
ncbi:MAG: low molecular weight protein-tyrosine-phosphatase [Leptonema sp. (in: bacteria)]